MSRATTLPRGTGSNDPLDRTERRRRPGSDQHVDVRQELLPPLRWLLQPNADRFAHPAEVELARLLSFYGLRWAYEPTTFAVRWGSDGRPQEFVTPDFYLPDHDLYLELTTMRQRLVTRKNRKFRLLRAAYPNVRVRLLYLRDFQRLQNVYQSLGPDQKARIGEILYDAQVVEGRIGELAHQLVDVWSSRATSEGGQRPLLVGVGSGAERFLESLGENIRRLGVGVDLDRAELTTITREAGPGRVRVSKPPAASLAGRSVTVVQEVLSTGLSTTFLSGWLRRRGASSVEACVLVDREAARVVDVPIICRGFSAPDVALAGFGLSRRREYRDLPFIAEIEMD